MFHHIKLVPLILGLAAGYFLLFYYVTPPVTIYSYPHPQNLEERVYRDNNKICYKYNANKVDCDAHESTLRQYPIQG